MNVADVAMRGAKKKLLEPDPNLDPAAFFVKRLFHVCSPASRFGLACFSMTVFLSTPYFHFR